MVETIPAKNNFLKKISRSFVSFFSVIVFLLMCVLITAGIVWPLWKWATTSPSSYSVCVLAIAVIFVLWQIFRVVRKTEKSRAIKCSLRIFFIALGIAAFVFLVLANHRIIAFCVLFVCIALSAAINSFLHIKANDKLSINR